MDRQRISWNSFLTPINNGFTARHGQNGLKKMGTNNRSVRSDVYEVRPGKSSFRMLLIKDGDSWTAVKLVHHDKIQKAIENF